MAFTSNESIVVDYYIASLGRSPDKAGLAYWAGELANGNKTQAQVRDFFMDQSIAEVAARFPAGQSNEDTVASVYNSVLGRVADAEGQAYWASRLDGTNTDGQPALSGLGELLDSLVAEAAKATNDSASLANKKAAAQYFIDNAVDGMTPPSTDSITDDATTLDTVKETINSDAIANGSVPGVKGEDFMLTKGLDNLVGTDDNDLFKGAIETGANSNVELNTASPLDTIDGGAGIDTFSLSSTDAITGIAQLPTLKNVEILSILGAAGVAVNTTSVDGLTNLNVTKATTVTLTASDAQNVNVAGASDDIDIAGGKNVTVNDKTTAKTINVGESGAGTTNAAGTITVTDTDNSGANAITVDGGTDVTVTATTKADATGAITVGDTTQATGNVVVTQNLNGDGAATLTNSGNIIVEGGKTVNVTVNATTTAKTATSDNDITVGTITVIGDSKTTDVTAKQVATATTKTADTVAQVDASSVVTFVAMAKDETTTVNGLTFTASKALTASEVAQAFANLTLGDTQTSTGPTANGVYTNASSTKAWTSGAADGATVTFTNADATEVAAAATTHKVVVSDTAAAGTVTAVSTNGAVKTGGDFATNAVVYGAVRVDGHATASIKTITLDGFASADLGSTGTDLNALTTLNIANNTANGNVDVATSSTKLALNVNNITSTTSVVDLDKTGATVADLTIGATGKASTFDLTAIALKDLTINADVALDIDTNASGYATSVLKTVDVNGAGAVNLGALTAASLNTFDASGNTGGVTASIDTATASIGTITDYIFSAGNDVVTLAETAVNTKVSLGAGDDKITLASGTTSLAKMIDGGTGTDTIEMVAANAATASGTTTFEANMSGFEKLSLQAIATGAQNKVDLDNMDDINYVVTAGTTDVAEVATVTITNTTAIAASTTETASITINGQTFTTAGLTTVGVGAQDAQVIGAALATLIQADAKYTTAASVGGVITITSAAANNGVQLDISAITMSETGVTTNVNAVTSSQLTLDNMLNDGTVELTAAGMGAVVTMQDATGTTDSLNIITGDNATTNSNINFGTIVADGVETIKVSTTNTFYDVAGATDGNGTTIADGKDDTTSKATLYIGSDKTTTINVDGAGDLTLGTLASTLTTVDASTMTGALTYVTTTDSVTVTGGLGKDQLTANTDDVKLNGGAGNDTLTVNSGADRAILDGGAGNDTFAINGAASTSSTYANILSVNSGDVIDFASVSTFKAAEITLSAGATETTQALMDLAVNNLALNEMGWFQTGGNTFIVMDAGSNSTTGFTDGQDMAVMITGLVDLSTASFNATSGTLEIA